MNASSAPQRSWSELLQEKRTPGALAERLLVYLILSLIAMMTIGPFVLTLLMSFMGEGWNPVFPPKLWPEVWSLKNYLTILTTQGGTYLNFPRALLNSTIVSGGATLVVCFVASLGGYSLAKLRYPGRDAIFLTMLSTMMIPGVVLLIPVYLILMKMGLLNKYAGLIIPQVSGVFGIFMMRQFVSQLPKSLEKAATIDGCTKFQIYWRIVLPLIKPALVTLGIITFMGSWNAFLWPLIIARDADMYTLQVGLVQLSTARDSEWAPLAAGILLSMLPSLVLFLTMQKYYVRGIVLGGIKG